MTRSFLLLGLLAGLASPAQAQEPGRASAAEMHRLEIRDGQIHHDGVRLPESALPEGLDLDGFTFEFQYSGPVKPAIPLGGRLYTIEGARLVELDEAQVAAEPQAFALLPEFTFAVETDEAAAQEHAQKVYLQGLSERDRALYEQLMREHEMEAEAFRLAAAIRQAPDGETRERLTRQLRDRLVASFELKQENRREEIRQVEALLETLRLRLREREAMRDQIIQHRMRELTGQ